MTTYERFRRMFEHREADRVPIIDSPWAGTLRRWHREGMPEGVDWRDYFGVDKVWSIGVDITPRYEVKVLEDTDRYTIATTPWGVTLKNFKELDSTPEFLDYKVQTPEAWADAKARMTLEDDRIPWDALKKNYDRIRAEGQWIEAEFWFGFDVTHSWMAGTETALVAMVEDPDWVRDMFDTYLDSCIALFGRIWDAGTASMRSSGRTTWATRGRPSSRTKCTANCSDPPTYGRWTWPTNGGSTRTCIPAGT